MSALESRVDRLPETVVENRSKHARCLHRPRDGTDDPRPACDQDGLEDAEFREVDPEVVIAFKRLCQNPECFGEDEDEIVTDGGQPVGDTQRGEEPTKWDEWTLLQVEWDCITRRAKSRFMEEWDKREDWKNFEARYHVYKAQDQLSVASYHSRQDDADELVKTNIADAVNHMLMAMATLGVDHGECQPILSQDDLVNDGGDRR